MNLGKHLNKLDRLKKQRHDAKKMQEYYTRQKTAAKNVKAHKKAKDNEEFYLQRITTLDGEIKEAEDQVLRLEEQLKAEAYHKDLTNFYNSIIEGFKDFEKAVKTIMDGGQADAVSAIEYIGLVYQKQYNQFKAEDLKMFQDYPILSLKGQIGRILEEQEAVFKITTTRGAPIAAQKRTNIETWGRNLLGQIESLIEAMKVRIK